MVVNPSVPARSVPEFIANAKAEPGKIIMASVGNGTTPQMAGELFKMMADVDLLHVPYQGAAPALTDLLGAVGGTPLKGSSADSEKLFVGDSEKWTKVMRAANVKAE